MTPASPSPPLVSIVIAAWNRARLVQRAVESILAQSHRRIELIVSDDHSEDDTLAVLRAFNDPRLQVFTQPQRVGVWENWTAAIRCTSGEYLVFVGDDDFLAPDFIEAHLECFHRHPEATLVVSPFEERSPEGRPLRSFPPPFPPDRLATPLDLLNAMVAMRVFFGAAMFRRGLTVEVWETTRPDEMVADVGMFLRLAAVKEVTTAVCPKVGCFKTTHQRQLSSGYFVVTELLKDVMLRVAALTRNPAYRRILLRTAALEGVTLGRHFAADRNLVRARKEFRQALRNAPTLTVPWTQWLLSWILPARVIRTARQQRGLPIDG